METRTEPAPRAAFALQLNLPDATTGTVELPPAAISISPGTGLVSFVELFADQDWTVKSDVPQHVSCRYAGACTIAGKPAGINVVFDDGKLSAISFCLRSNGKRWDDWSEQEERLHLELLTQWLHSTYGSHQLAWGSAHASYDPRSASSQLVVHYQPASDPLAAHGCGSGARG